MFDHNSEFPQGVNKIIQVSEPLHCRSNRMHVEWYPEGRFDRVHYSRFFTPWLAGYKGWALFCDCDFLLLDDIAELQSYNDPSKAVYCVQHDYQPREGTKMDGKAQTTYPRKNWSSCMLLNREHPSTRQLTPQLINKENGAYLHRMQWANDDEIETLPIDDNWLEGWNEKPECGHPEVVHFTRGGPWFKDWQNVDYADIWRAEADIVQPGWKPI